MKWCFLLLVSLTLSAEETASLLFEAQEALFDGKVIELKGDVYVEHELGKLLAGQGTLAGLSSEKKLRFSQLDLYDHVRLLLTQGGELCCAEAHLNQQTSLGEFLGSEAQPFVVYMEQCRDACHEHARFPMILKSRAMHIEFKRDASPKKSPKSHINAILARENVTVDYNHDFIAAADRATYHHEESEAAQGDLSGIICLHAEGEEGRCHITNRNGDLIHARQIFVDTLHRRLCFVHPKGALFTLRTGYSKERVDFSSDTLTWAEQDGKLTLRGHVMIAQQGLGQLDNEEEVTLFQSLSNGRKQLSMMESTGHTILAHQEGGSHNVHCYGKMVVDHTALCVTMTSPEGEERLQVYYQDPHGDIYADSATLQYGLVSGMIAPKKLTLEGHVRMVNKPAKGGDREKKQYILADRVEYFPDTRVALLSAQEGSRVLVYDQINDLQVSAPGLKINRDEGKRESIEGIGDVRFNFIDPEFERLYKRFEDIKKQVNRDGT